MMHTETTITVASRDIQLFESSIGRVFRIDTDCNLQGSSYPVELRRVACQAMVVRLEA